MIKTMSINENPNIGVFCKANEELVMVAPQTNERYIADFEEVFKCEVIRATVGGLTILGSLITMNSNGIVISNLVDIEEFKKLVKRKLNVVRIPDKLNAIGNNVLANDRAAIVHPQMSKGSVDAIADALCVEVIKETIAGLKTVGSAAVATNKGVLCHPKTSSREIEFLKEVFKVNVNTGTVNYGTPQIGAGLVANSKGAIVGDQTTGIELYRIESTLGLIE